MGYVVYRYQKNITVLEVMVLYTVGLLNTVVYHPVVLILKSFHYVTICFISSSQILVILHKLLHEDEISSRSSAYVKTSK